MTPFSAPGAAAKPPAATPRAPILARAPRPVMGSYGNLGTPVRVAPRVQAPPPTARMPIARPHMPLAPHAQGAPIPGAPRPMGSGFAAAAPTPRMQQAPPRAPGIPPNTRGVGAAVPSARPHMPLLQPTQRAAPAVANPSAPSLAKRALPTTTMDPAPVQQAKRQATMIPRPQGAAPGGVPLPTNPAAVVRAPVPPKHAQAAPATPSRPPPSQVQVRVFGVRHDPSKGWMARVVDPKRRVAREIGPFGEMHLAALAQDRVVIACAGRGIGGGGRAPLNFEPAFYRVETAFLHRWEGDLCGALEEGTYEKIYAKFLMAGYKAALNVKEDGEGDSADAHEDELIASCVGDGEFFWEDIEYFFLHRATEIGKDALEDNREKLRSRFVEMHRNMSLCQDWRRRNHMEKLKTMMSQNQQQQQIQMQQQQQQIQMNQEQRQQIQMNQEQQQQPIQMKQGQQQQQPIQMKQEQQPQEIQWQQPQQIQMMQQQRRQQQFQQQQRMMMIQEHRQQQLMSAQQQQQYQDDDATVQVKPELSSSS